MREKSVSLAHGFLYGILALAEVCSQCTTTSLSGQIFKQYAWLSVLHGRRGSLGYASTLTQGQYRLVS